MVRTNSTMLPLGTQLPYFELDVVAGHQFDLAKERGLNFKTINNQSLSNKKIATENIVKDDSNGKNESIDTSTKEIEDDNPKDHGSIEAVPFISKPARKKSIKTKKETD